MRKGLAKMVTGVSPRCERRTRMRRRVGSARAAKMAVTWFCLLTTGRTIAGKIRQCQGIVRRLVKYSPKTRRQGRHLAWLRRGRPSLSERECARLLGFWRGGGLREGDEVAGGILDGEFAHAVEGGALGHDFRHILQGNQDVT